VRNPLIRWICEFLYILSKKVNDDDMLIKYLIGEWL